MPPRRQIVHLTDGEWFRVTRRKQREMCCDCHLVHDIDYRIKDGRIEFRATRNDRATAASRRVFNFGKPK